MIVNVEALPEDWFAERSFDACVIGSGPAGITLARRLAAGGISVALFEGGGEEIDEKSQALYRGDVLTENYEALDETRLRYFGGTSNHWSGWTRALDHIDFEPRNATSSTGWPIRKRDLDKYAAEADSVLDLSPKSPMAPADFLVGVQDSFEPIAFRFSPPTRFADKYRRELEVSDSISLFLNANLVDLQLNDASRIIEAAVFRSYERPDPFLVRAGCFVLCMGGLENPRFLLNADSQRAGGIGNENGLVGRYFADHPHVPVGRIVLRTPLLDDIVAYGPKLGFMTAHSVSNFGLRIFRISPPSDSGHLPEECTKGLEAIIAADLAGTPFECPGLTASALLVIDPAPNPDSRVALGDHRDRFGLRRIRLEWRLSDVDHRTLKVASFEFARALLNSDVGRMKISPWILNEDPLPTGGEFWGNHHMCTTRMSDSPKNGVVDANCRLHSVENLYIGGSSVFPTTGHANPTYTIVQLALRLGDHLLGLK